MKRGTIKKIKIGINWWKKKCDSVTKIRTKKNEESQSSQINSVGLHKKILSVIWEVSSSKKKVKEKEDK